MKNKKGAFHPALIAVFIVILALLPIFTTNYLKFSIQGNSISKPNLFSTKKPALTILLEKFPSKIYGEYNVRLIIYDLNTCSDYEGNRNEIYRDECEIIYSYFFTSLGEGTHFKKINFDTPNIKNIEIYIELYRDFSGIPIYTTYNRII